MDMMQPAQSRIASRLKARCASPCAGKLRESLGAALPELFGYVYRGTSDADLAAYLAFNAPASVRATTTRWLRVHRSARGRQPGVGS